MCVSVCKRADTADSEACSVQNEAQNPLHFFFYVMLCYVMVCMKKKKC